VTDDSPGSRRPGRPRRADADQAIISATLDRIAADGVNGLSLEKVAADAGVAKTTIYRRWPTKEALLLDALASMGEDLPELAGESVRDDLIAMIDAMRRRYQDARTGRIMHQLLGEAHRHPEIARRYKKQVVEIRRQRLREVFRRGMENGELPADLDVELALLLVTAPILVQTILRAPDELPRPGPDVSARIVDAVLDGIAPR
jgi:AcrR family transcriptional regulator